MKTQGAGSSPGPLASPGQALGPLSVLTPHTAALPEPRPPPLVPLSWEVEEALAPVLPQPAGPHPRDKGHQMLKGSDPSPVGPGHSTQVSSQPGRRPPGELTAEEAASGALQRCVVVGEIQRDVCRRNGPQGRLLSRQEEASGMGRGAGRPAVGSGAWRPSQGVPSSERGKRGTWGRPGDPESGDLRTDGEASFRREEGEWGGQKPLLTPGKETCPTRRAQSSDRKNQARPGNQEIHDAIGNYASFSQKLTCHSGKTEQTK